jgi:glycogen debranching enzyme
MHERIRNGASADTMPGAGPAQPEEIKWEKFGKVETEGSDHADPQRHILTSCIFRAGSSALVVISEGGVIDSAQAGETGLYVDDMRVVSTLSFAINGKQPVVSSIEKDELMTDIQFKFQTQIPQLEVGVEYTLGEDVLLARLRLKNTGDSAVGAVVDFNFHADHFDTFYVRFPPKPERGILHPAVSDVNGRSIRYDRIDGKVSQSFIRFSENPERAPDGAMRFTRSISRQQQWEIVVQTGLDSRVPNNDSWEQARNALETQRKLPFAHSAEVETDNARLGRWIRQSKADLCALTANLDTGLYPYAGLPWFALPFGRDGLITGFETIELNPSVMRGVLLYLAKHQAHGVDVVRQAWPGKIMHEMRLGETSRAGLNPFDGYYGGVDTTLLFVMAAGTYWRRTGDDAFIKALWPAIDLALRWISDYGDIDGDGLVEYEADSGMGLTNQGWKDSWDAIVNEAGEFPVGPIALCEVQGYAFAAWRAGQAIAARLGFDERAEFCGKAADRIYQRFNETFWQEDLGIYALALDGKKQPCRVRASNMGHLPWCGIVPSERAQRVIDQLLDKRLFSGWGIRTLAEGEISYRPDLYHRGPCWPHEMAIASWSAAKVGDVGALQKLSETTLDTAEAFGFRLPELLCGYPRVKGQPPVSYKSANPWHSWAAAVAFAQVQSALGLKVEAGISEVSLDTSGLPPNWAPLTIRNLEVDSGCISFRIEPDGFGEFSIRVLDSRGAIRIHDRRAEKLLAHPD